jgi:lysozyme
MNNTIKQKLMVAFIALGLSAPAAFVAYDLTMPSEGFRQSVYIDPVGLPTVCIGRMDKSLKLGQKFSVDECMKMFAEDWKKHQAQLNSVVNVGYASEWQKEALTDFTFNLGIGNVKSSTLIRKLNAKDHVGACKELTKWVKGRVKGQLVTLRGLVTRRNNTMPFCMGELSYDKQKAYEDFKREYDNEVSKRQKEGS